jgi:hypothetical protein
VADIKTLRHAPFSQLRHSKASSVTLRESNICEWGGYGWSGVSGFNRHFCYGAFCVQQIRPP